MYREEERKEEKWTRGKKKEEVTLLSVGLLFHLRLCAIV
jgi:hypothetical protein